MVGFFGLAPLVLTQPNNPNMPLKGPPLNAKPPRPTPRVNQVGHEQPDRPVRKRADFVIRKNITSFGSVIAASDDAIVISAPKAHIAFVYTKSDTQGGEWNWGVHPLNGPGDDFGKAVAIGFGHALVSAPSLHKVYMFRPSERAGHVWEIIRVWEEPGVEGFGESVALRQHLAVVGAPGARMVFLYRRQEEKVDNVTRWPAEPAQLLNGTDYPSFGATVALASDSVVVGAPEARTVFAYTRNEHPNKASKFILNPANLPPELRPPEKTPWEMWEEHGELSGVTGMFRMNQREMRKKFTTPMPEWMEILHGSEEHRWIPEEEVHPEPSILPNPEEDGFGCAVAASRGFVIVGSHGRQGYVFETPEIDPNDWRAKKKRRSWHPEPTAILEGGGSCKVSAAGKRAMVGSLRERHASVFRSTDRGYWPEVEQLQEKKSEEKFGVAVALSRNNAIVSGRRCVFIYDRAFGGMPYEKQFRGKSTSGVKFGAFFIIPVFIMMAILNRPVLEKFLSKKRMVPIKNPMFLFGLSATVFVIILYRIFHGDLPDDRQHPDREKIWTAWTEPRNAIR